MEKDLKSMRKNAKKKKPKDYDELPRKVPGWFGLGSIFAAYGAGLLIGWADGWWATLIGFALMLAASFMIAKYGIVISRLKYDLEKEKRNTHEMDMLELNVALAEARQKRAEHELEFMQRKYHQEVDAHDATMTVLYEHQAELAARTRHPAGKKVKPKGPVPIPITRKTDKTD